MLTTSSNFQFLLTQTHQVNGESLSFEWLESQFFTAIGKGLQLKLEFETEFIAKAPTCIQSHPTPQLAISFQSHQWRNLDLSSITLSSESKNLSLLNIVILGTFMTKFWRALVLVNLCLGPHEVYLQKVSLHSFPELLLFNWRILGKSDFKPNISKGLRFCFNFWQRLEFWMKIFLNVSIFQSSIFQRVSCWINKFTWCQILNQIIGVFQCENFTYFDHVYFAQRFFPCYHQQLLPKII